MNKIAQILLLLIPFFSFSQTDTVAHLYTFGGNNNDNAEEIEATTDGGYIVVGSTSSNSSGNTDIYLSKVDSLCNYEWSTALGGTNNDWGYSLKQTFDKGFIIAATSNSYGNGGYDAVLMKIDSLGNYVWTKTYGGNDWDFAYSVVQTYDSGFVFCGETYNNTNGYSDVYIVKTNSLGDTLWTRTYGGTLIDKGNSVIETSDSNIVVAGITNTITDSTQIYIIKLTATGTLLWDSIYGGSLYENANQIIETYDGGYVIASCTNSNSVGGDQNYLIKKVGSNGNSLWEFTIVNGPSPTPDDEDAYTIYELSNNNLLISGYSKTGGNSKNVIFFELLSGGWWAGSSSVIGHNDDDFIKRVTIGNNGNILGAGSTRSFGAGMDDVLLVRLDTIYGGQDTSTFSYIDNTPLFIQEDGFFEVMSIYPNPVNHSFSVLSNTNVNIDEINVYDIIGKNVYSNRTKKSDVNISYLKSGIYIVQIRYNLEKYYQVKIIKY